MSVNLNVRAHHPHNVETNSFLTVVILAAKHANKATAVSVVGGLAESGVRWPVLCWCIWQQSGLDHHEDGFKFHLDKKKFVLSKIELQ